MDLAFDQDGKRIDANEVLATVARNRAERYGKVQEELHELIERDPSQIAPSQSGCGRQPMSRSLRSRPGHIPRSRSPPETTGPLILTASARPPTGTSTTRRSTAWSWATTTT